MVYRPGMKLPKSADELDGTLKSAILLLLLDADSIRADYLRALAGFEELYREACHKGQIDYVAMDTGRNFGDALLEYLQQRSRRG